MRAAEASAIVLLVVLIAVTGAPLGRSTWRAQSFRVSRARPIESRVDGALYRVHTGYQQPKAAADLLAAIHGKCIDLMWHLRARYIRSPLGAQFPDRAAITRRLLDNYDPDALTESSPHNPDGDTSFSLDKGKLLAICLRERHAIEIGDPSKYDLHDVMTVMFVVVHELAHLGTREFGHPPAFWGCFKFLLAEAVDAGVVAAWPDYNRHPVRYCGVTIDYSPVSDAGVAMPA
jgi:hypothetical protein